MKLTAVFFRPNRRRSGGDWVAIYKTGDVAHHVALPDVASKTAARRLARDILRRTKAKVSA